MNKNNKIVADELEVTSDICEQDKVLKYVVDGIDYKPLNHVLIKPLEDIVVTKKVTSMVPKEEKNDNGEIEYDTIEEEKEVTSNWKKGIVLVLPSNDFGFKLPFEVGDTIVYNRGAGIEFDLFKDAVLILPGNVTARVK